VGTSGQTAGVYVLAGGSGFFSPACVKALAQCGLHPDDFGSYEHVKKRIRAAKKKEANYKAAKKRKDRKLPPKPDAHDKLLIKSQAGHARQNAIFQRKRSNSCKNEPGATGYHHDLAPSMPHIGKAEKAGSTHWAVSDHDDSIRQDGAAKPRKTSLSADQIKEHSAKGSLISARGASPEQVADRGRGPKTIRKNEAKLRQESATKLDPANAAKPGSPESEAAINKAAKKAAECIEKFIEKAFQQMQAQVMQDYGPDYKKTKAGLAQAEADAKARKEDAEKRLKKAKEEKDGAAYGQAKADLAQAGQDYDQAKGANKSARCMRAQALQLAAQGKPLPPMSGSVPPGSDTRRSQRPLPAKKKSGGKSM